MKKLLNKMKYVKLSDFIHIFYFLIAFIPALVFKTWLSTNKDPLWLVCDSKYEARDNGFSFFKFVKTNHSKQYIVFALDPNSPDYLSVSAIGKTISYGTITHWFYYLSASKNISSQKGGKPNAAITYFLEVYGFIKNTRVFLQHGVILNDLKWLYYKNTKIDLFITSSFPEHNFVLEKFGYPKNNIKYLGLSRFDDLHNIPINKDLILFMPSWRNWIVLPTKDSYHIEDISDFENTMYYKKIQSFLENSELHRILENTGKKMIFYPHRDMYKFINKFKSIHSSIQILDYKQIDIRNLLKESALMITDYSSVSMDFGYMKKPVIYYQFDKEQFRQAHYQEGYFNYERDGFGEVVEDEEKLVKIIESSIYNNFQFSKENLSRHKKTFKLFDCHNSKRIFDAIEEM